MFTDGSFYEKLDVYFVPAVDVKIRLMCNSRENFNLRHKLHVGNPVVILLTLFAALHFAIVADFSALHHCCLNDSSAGDSKIVLYKC